MLVLHVPSKITRYLYTLTVFFQNESVINVRTRGCHKRTVSVTTGLIFIFHSHHLYSLYDFQTDNVCWQEQHRCGMKKLILCWVRHGFKVWRKNSNWTVTREEFPDDVYPDYCSGTAVLYSQVQKY